jgi:hypothetical protein
VFVPVLPFLPGQKYAAEWTGSSGQRRCVDLERDRDLIRGQAGFHWWPDRVAAN